jgi:hypothetical protein
MMFGQALVIALLFAILYGDISREGLADRVRHSSSLLFLLAVSCLWFGCNNAAKEIVKERVIYERERNINLMIASYYASKLLLLGAISLLQVTVLYGTVKWLTGLPGGAGGQWAFCAAMAASGVTLGLFISAAAKSNDMAITIVPIVLIPQIALGGVVVPLQGMGENVARVFISAYWGYRGLATLLPDEITSQLRSNDWSTGGSCFMVLLHSAVFVATAIAILFFQARGRR